MSMSQPPQSENTPDRSSEDAATPTSADTQSVESGPTEDGPEPTGNPVDPAMATSTPDPHQTGRGEREG
jgi:hypothetical protein